MKITHQILTAIVISGIATCVSANSNYQQPTTNVNPAPSALSVSSNANLSNHVPHASNGIANSTINNGNMGTNGNAGGLGGTSIGTDSGINVIVPLSTTQTSTTQPVCVRCCTYNNQTYSQGAVININGIVLQCVAEMNPHTLSTNNLVWQRLSK